MTTKKPAAPQSSPLPIRLTDDEREYCAEMGMDWAERDAFLQRKADAIEAEAAAVLPCGHVSHENGGPSDYPAKCRNIGGC